MLCKGHLADHVELKKNFHFYIFDMTKWIKLAKMEGIVHETDHASSLWSTWLVLEGGGGGGVRVGRPPIPEGCYKIQYNSRHMNRNLLASRELNFHCLLLFPD